MSNMLPVEGYRVVELDISVTETIWREMPVLGLKMTDEGQLDLIVFAKSDSGELLDDQPVVVTFSEYKRRYAEDDRVRYKRWILSPKDADLDENIKKRSEEILIKRLLHSAKTSA